MRLARDGFSGLPFDALLQGLKNVVWEAAARVMKIVCIHCGREFAVPRKISAARAFARIAAGRMSCPLLRRPALKPNRSEGGQRAGSRARCRA